MLKPKKTIRYVLPVPEGQLSKVADEACKQPSMNSACLLLGHRGCGKSTELNKMSEKLRNEGYQVQIIHCKDSLDFNDPLYADILILMCDALLIIRPYAE